MDDDLDRSRAETRAAFVNRALLYRHVFDELAGEIGRRRATEVLSRAIRKRGLEVGLKYRPAAEAGDLEEVGRIFCEDSPAGGALFEPDIVALDADRIVLSMSACPLVDAWREAGLGDEEVDELCAIAAAVDEGTFEAAGLDLTFIDRRGCAGSDRCLLELRLREPL